MQRCWQLWQPTPLPLCSGWKWWCGCQVCYHQVWGGLSSFWVLGLGGAGVLHDRAAMCDCCVSHGEQCVHSLLRGNAVTHTRAWGPAERVAALRQCQFCDVFGLGSAITARPPHSTGQSYYLATLHARASLPAVQLCSVLVHDLCWEWVSRAWAALPAKCVIVG